MTRATLRLLPVLVPGSSGQPWSCFPIWRAISGRTRDSTCPGASGVMVATNLPCLVITAGRPAFSISPMRRAACSPSSCMVKTRASSSPTRAVGVPVLNGDTAIPPLPLGLPLQKTYTYTTQERLKPALGSLRVPRVAGVRVNRHHAIRMISRMTTAAVSDRGSPMRQGAPGAPAQPPTCRELGGCSDAQGTIADRTDGRGKRGKKPWNRAAPARVRCRGEKDNIATAAWKRASYRPQDPPSECDRVRLRAGLDCSVTGAMTAPRGQVESQTRPVPVPGSDTAPAASWPGGSEAK